MRSATNYRKASVGIAAFLAVFGGAFLGARSLPRALAATNPAATVAPCTTSGLVVWLNTDGDGAAGSIYYDLEFTNLSAHACALSGYPGVSAVSLTGRQLGSAASRDSAHAPHAVVLADGATTSIALRIVEAGNFPASTCRQTTAAGIRVFPPNQTLDKVIPFPFSACSRPGPIYLTTRAL